MLTEHNIKNYKRSECIVFRYTNETFGGLSNMSKDFPIVVNDTAINSIEALYQACRYPHHPDIQRQIIKQATPKESKRISRNYTVLSRPDWESVKVLIMKWCLRIKLVQNWDEFSRLLLQTDNKQIVEESVHDSFWGAQPCGDTLEGTNALGRLLMELRELVRDNPNGNLESISPLKINQFDLFGEEISSVSFADKERIYGCQAKLI